MTNLQHIFICCRFDWTLAYSVLDILHAKCYCVCCKLRALNLLEGCNALRTTRIEWLVTFSSSIREHRYNNHNHYHSYAQYNDESIIFCTRNKQFICEKQRRISVNMCQNNQHQKWQCWQVMSYTLAFNMFDHYGNNQIYQRQTVANFPLMVKH